MINLIRNKYLNRRVIQQFYFNLYHNILFRKGNKDIFNSGYHVFDKNFPFENINLDKYLNFPNNNFVSERRKIDLVDLKKIYDILSKIGAISVIKDYFGTKIYSYDNSVLTLGNKKSSDGSFQPHHDSKGRRIKIYIWLNDKNLNTHPLYYLKKTHKQILNWKKYEDTRFPNINKKKFDAIYGNKGNIIFFDTHGIHSHFKETDVPRSVIELTFEPFGLLNRLNSKNIKSETERLGLIDLDELIK
tara:strand:+ start:1549 stop:2283 length:735 start_codon:yes stop_codon:yes gene_type:complete